METARCQESSVKKPGQSLHEQSWTGFFNYMILHLHSGTRESRQLRRVHCSTEDSPRRLHKLRGANAGRKSVHSERPNFGEAAVIGGDDLLVTPPPANTPLTEGSRQLRRAHCSSEVIPRRIHQLRGANVGRRSVRGGRPNSCEAAVVGGNNLLVSPPPATIP